MYMYTCTHVHACSLHSPVKVYDEVDGLEEDGIFSVGVLHLLGLAGLLGAVQHRLETLAQTSANHCIIWGEGGG